MSGEKKRVHFRSIVEELKPHGWTQSERRVSKSRVMENHLQNVWAFLANRKNVSFHRAMRWSILILQVVPLFPVVGIMSPSAKYLHHNRWNIVNILNMILLTSGTIEAILEVRLAFQLGFGVTSASAVAFYLVSLYIGYCLRYLALNWPNLMRVWDELEAPFLRSPYNAPKHNLTKVLTICASFMALYMTVEHITYYINSFYETAFNIEYCNLTGKVGLIEHMFNRERAQYFQLFKFQTWMAPFMEWQNFSFAICWTMLDCVIVNIALGLTTRFDQFNERVRSHEETDSMDVWFELRSHFGQLTDLVLYVNRYLGKLILISCGNNMYFICYFIFKCFTPRENITDRIHFWIQISIIVGRTLAMLFACAGVHDSSRKSLKTLRNMPQRCWNVEAQRLLDQIESQTVALSGSGLYKITRKSILAFAASVVTFEIALMDKSETESTRSIVCKTTF